MQTAIVPPVDSEWVSRQQPDRGIYRVTGIRPARRATRHPILIGPDAICARHDRIVVVPVRCFQPGGPLVPHVREEEEDRG